MGGKKRRKTAVTLRHVIERNWQYCAATLPSSFRVSRREKSKGVKRRRKDRKTGNILTGGSSESLIESRRIARENYKILQSPKTQEIFLKSSRIIDLDREQIWTKHLHSKI